MSYEQSRGWLNAVVGHLDEMQKHEEEEQTEDAHLGRIRVVEPHPVSLHSDSMENLRFRRQSVISNTYTRE